jgi:hypothetical protein
MSLIIAEQKFNAQRKSRTRWTSGSGKRLARVIAALRKCDPTNWDYRRAIVSIGCIDMSIRWEHSGGVDLCDAVHPLCFP